MTNVARHAEARRVTIRLACHEPLLILVVEDDGLGLRTSGELTDTNGKPTGLGMTSMRARARRLGGDLDVSSVRPHGLRVRVELPLQPGGAAGPGS